MLPKSCRALRCPNKTTNHHGYCDKHANLASWGKYQQQRGKSIYNSSKWKKTREAIMKRDLGLCQECKREGRIKSGTECDHIKPVSAGGDTWSYSNLEMLCKECHKAKTARESHGR